MLRDERSLNDVGMPGFPSRVNNLSIPNGLGTKKRFMISSVPQFSQSGHTFMLKPKNKT